MGRTPEALVTQWMKLAGQEGKSGAVRERVKIAGEFLVKSAAMNEKRTQQCFRGIDFSKQVTAVRLPAGVYVQYVLGNVGSWFTETGLTPDLVGVSDMKVGDHGRKRTLFVPNGTVHALQSTAQSIRDTWTFKKLYPGADQALIREMAPLTRGGGTQYFVLEAARMKKY